MTIFNERKILWQGKAGPVFTGEYSGTYLVFFRIALSKWRCHSIVCCLSAVGDNIRICF